MVYAHHSALLDKTVVVLHCVQYHLQKGSARWCDRLGTPWTTGCRLNTLSSPDCGGYVARCFVGQPETGLMYRMGTPVVTMGVHLHATTCFRRP